MRRSPLSGRLKGVGVLSGSRMVSLVRSSWVDIAWVVFIGLNLLAMRLVPAWQTIPFLIIWVSLTALYGYRLWHLGSTLLTVLTITLATGGLIRGRVARGDWGGYCLGAAAPLPLILLVRVTPST